MQIHAGPLTITSSFNAPGTATQFSRFLEGGSRSGRLCASMLAALTISIYSPFIYPISSRQPGELDHATALEAWPCNTDCAEQSLRLVRRRSEAYEGGVKMYFDRF
jgi:hypothetical protein